MQEDIKTMLKMYEFILKIRSMWDKVWRFFSHTGIMSNRQCASKSGHTGHTMLYSGLWYEMLKNKCSLVLGACLNCTVLIHCESNLRLQRWGSHINFIHKESINDTGYELFYV